MLNLKLCVFIRELLSPRSAARMCGEIMATEWDDLSQPNSYCHRIMSNMIIK